MHSIDRRTWIGAFLDFFKEIVMPVVRVSWFEGKDESAKKAVAAEITESIVKNTGTSPEHIYVIFEDIAPSNWAGSGKLFGQESKTPQDPL
ncbi:tautomerase family protein [Limnobacter sp.]|uniref:tautomerase family protein n=1 Tax=Limnobacter sp. TaxID=2003368 RepID=UPI0039C97523